MNFKFHFKPCTLCIYPLSKTDKRRPLLNNNKIQSNSNLNYPFWG
ncbi:17852_t:CDS:2 [Entrophospora sp. SA101]|nr:17852_t:CDS:2 [Entrophospora sp. SA101]